MNEIEKMRIDILESVTWKELDDGILALDIDSTTDHLRSKGYRKQVDDASSGTTNNEGKWEKRVFIIFDSEKVGYKCSECNTTWDTPTHYCPNCGAKMKGGE